MCIYIYIYMYIYIYIEREREREREILCQASEPRPEALPGSVPERVPRRGAQGVPTPPTE